MEVKRLVLVPLVFVKEVANILVAVALVAKRLVIQELVEVA